MTDEPICLTRIFGAGSRTFVHREFPETLARVRSIRREVPVKEGFTILPWFRQRDRSGRFVRKAVTS